MRAHVMSCHQVIAQALMMAMKQCPSQRRVSFALALRTVEVFWSGVGGKMTKFSPDAG